MLKNAHFPSRIGKISSLLVNIANFRKNFLVIPPPPIFLFFIAYLYIISTKELKISRLSGFLKQNPLIFQ